MSERLRERGKYVVSEGLRERGKYVGPALREPASEEAA